MKKTLFLIAMLLVVISGAKAQNWCVFSWMTDGNASEFSFDFIHNNTGDTLFHGEGYSNNSFYSYSIPFPDGQVRCDIHDSGCNGFQGGGMMTLSTGYSSLWHVIGNFGCLNTKVMNFTWYDPCYNPCNTDFDLDGVVDVDDLLYFISTYGNTCE